MTAANKVQNARFNEFSRRTGQQLLHLNTALQTLFAQTSEKGKICCKYSVVDLSVEKRTRTSIVFLQQGTRGARTLLECPSAQGSLGTRTAVECLIEETSNWTIFWQHFWHKPYGISVDNLRIITGPENIESKIRLHCSSNDKDIHQAEDKDVENASLESISQKLSVKEAAIGKPLNSSKLASVANNVYYKYRRVKV